MQYQIKPFWRTHWWKMVSYLPLNLRHYLIRQIIKIPKEFPQDIVIKIAESKDEYEQVFRLLYLKELEDSQHFGPQVEFARLTKYHFVPGSVVIIAKKKDKVIAALNLTCDSAMGLPSDQSWDLNEVRKKSHRLVEVSGLTIAKHSEHRRGQLLIPMCKYFLHYSMDYLQADILILSPPYSARDFYRALFLSKKIKQPAHPHIFSPKIPCLPHTIDLENLKKKLHKVYKNSSERHNIFSYLFSKSDHKKLLFPNRTYHKAFDKIFKPKEMEYYCREKILDLSKLTNQDLLHLKNFYHYPEYCELFDKHFLIAQRTHLRLPAFLKGEIVNLNNQYKHYIPKIKVKSVNVSQGGLAIECNRRMKPYEKHLLKIEIAPKKVVGLIVEPCYIKEKIVGLKLVHGNEEWNQYISTLEEDFKEYHFEQKAC